jgi:hypothetical protein
VEQPDCNASVGRAERLYSPGLVGDCADVKYARAALQSRGKTGPAEQLLHMTQLKDAHAGQGMGTKTQIIGSQ